MRKVIDIPIWYQKNRIIELRKKLGFNQQTVADKIGCVLKTYQNYEQGHNYPTLEYATKLAELYNVSIDYLLGRSDCISVENEKIKEIIGINDSSIETLKLLNLNDGITQAGHNEIETLNIFLSDLECTLNFLGGLQDYINARYKIPIYHTGKHEIVNGYLQPQCVVPNSKYDVIYDIPLLTLAKDKDNPNDNYQIPLTNSFFEGIALKTIEKSIIDLRNNLNNWSDAHETT